MPPTPGSVEAIASDTFWNRVIHCPLAVDFDATTLAEVTREADVIVRGRITDYYVAEHWRSRPNARGEPFAYVRLEIDELLKGEPVSRMPGAVEVQYMLLGRGQWADFSAVPVPAHEQLFFLVHEATDREERGASPRDYSEVAPYAYFALDGSGLGMLRSVDGLISVIRPAEFLGTFDAGRFPYSLNGMPFDDVAERVRDLLE